MKWFFRLVACLALMPCVVGCDEILKATDATKQDEKAKVNSTSADPSKRRAEATGVDWVGLTNDPMVAETMHARDQIAQLEEEILSQLDELRSLLASAKAEPEKLRQSVELFLEITKDLREKTRLVNEAIQALSEQTADLSRSSRHLASSYRALADLFRKKARDYSEKRLRDELISFAKDYDEIAKSMPERCKALDAVQKKLPTLKKKVREVNTFLTDTVSFLNSHPSIGSDRRERYAGEFESFAVTFSEWIRTLDELRQALRQQAVSKVIQEDVRKERLAFQRLEETKREEEARVVRAKAEELAKAEQVKRDEQLRLAKFADEEQQKLTLERVRLAKEREAIAEERATLAKNTEPPKPLTAARASSDSFVTTAVIPNKVCVTACPPPVTCSCSRAAPFRLIPLFRRCP